MPSDRAERAVSAAPDRYRGRKEERVRIALPVHFSRSGRGEKPHSAHTVDISNSGARLAGLQVELEVGEVLNGMRQPAGTIPRGVERQQGNGDGGPCRTAVLAVDADIWKLDQGQLQVVAPLLRARAVQRGLLPQEHGHWTIPGLERPVGRSPPGRG